MNEFERIITARWDEPDTVWADRYARLGGYRGLRTALGMSPAEMAQASSVTTAASAASGDRKYVIGTMRATAMVAERPGMEPNNVP